MKEQFPGIFDICRGSFIDGPGIRTVVFFTGCPLRCEWCQNPESWSAEGMIELTRFSPMELVNYICHDQTFFNVSGGGVTFSGGEPLLYPQYLQEVCLLLKGQGVHCAVETSGYFKEDVFSLELDSLIDLFLFDVKIMNPDDHLKVTGGSNDLIHNNLERLAGMGRAIWATIPLIPGYTSTETNLSAIAALLIEHKIKHFEIRPYNPSCIDKRKKLGIPASPLLHSQPFSLKEEIFWKNYFGTLMKNNSSVTGS
jgi:pyruvate formate lyase activating enzyme